NPGKFSESDDDIELSLGNKRLNPRSILVCWPRLVYEFTAPQAKLAAHEVAAAKTPKPARSAPKSKPTKKRAKRLPSLRRRMIIAVLRRKFPGGFSDDDIPGKVKVVCDGWRAECRAPLGDDSRPVSYDVPNRMMVLRTIRDYLERPSAYD